MFAPRIPSRPVRLLDVATASADIPKTIAEWVARHDGPLSVLRSFTLDEFQAMARAAGQDGITVRTHPLFRVVLVRWPEARKRGNLPFDSRSLPRAESRGSLRTSDAARRRL